MTQKISYPSKRRRMARELEGQTDIFKAIGNWLKAQFSRPALPPLNEDQDLPISRSEAPNLRVVHTTKCGSGGHERQARLP